MSTSANDWNSPFDDLSTDPAGMPVADSAATNAAMIGTPDIDRATWDGQQSYPDTCAIRCQEFILEQFTGQEIDETALVQEAAQHGWYQPGGGTSPQDVGNLLELHGVEVNRYEHANIHNLANELAQGHKVIIGVDSGELWEQNSLLEWLDDLFGIDGADHAVVVSGIDTSDPNDPRVIVSDPGTGEAVASYPMDQFLDAWEDSDFFMVATQDPAPPSLPEMQHFDYDEGHIPEVAGMPYDEFVTWEEDPEGWVLWFDENTDPATFPDGAVLYEDPLDGGVEEGIEPVDMDGGNTASDHSAEETPGGGGIDDTAEHETAEEAGDEADHDADAEAEANEDGADAENEDDSPAAEAEVSAGFPHDLGESHEGYDHIEQAADYERDQAALNLQWAEASLERGDMEAAQHYTDLASDDIAAAAEFDDMDTDDDEY